LNRGEIRRLGRRFGLVTRETSLIVLEIVADYARFEITPPPELRDEYERLVAAGVARREVDNQAHLNQIAARYQQRITWWEREFPKGRIPAPVEDRGRTHLKENAMATIGIRALDGEPPENRARLGSAQQAPAPSSVPPAKTVAPVPKPAAKPAAKPMPLQRRADDVDAVTATRRELAQLQGVALAADANKREIWRNDSTAAQRLREAAPGEVYRIYLDERPGYAHEANYYTDAAEMLLRAGQPELALRVLSNLAEMDLENRHNLRQLAMRLQLAGHNDLAIPLLERVRDLAPEEPQSHRDLALALVARGDHQRAVDLLYHVVERRWDARFPDIGVMAAVDMNAVITSASAAGKTLDTGGIDTRLMRHLPLDVRVVLTWDADNTNIDLVVTDPNERLQRYGLPSYQGGLLSMNFVGGYGPEEYALRNAKPGKYRIEARHSGHRQQVSRPIDPTVLVRVQTAFGTPQQQEKLYSVRLSRVGEMRFAGELEIPGVAEENR
jgi:tetratricopeptide (TPR) repeat protein